MGKSEVALVDDLDIKYMSNEVGFVICGDIVRVEMRGDYDAYDCDLSRDEVIATARAILKHFGEGLE